MPTDPRPRKRRHRKYRRRNPLNLRAIVMLSAPVLLLGVGLLPHRPWLLYNHTPSVPIGVYRYAGRTPQRGNLVAFYLPDAAHDYARQRGEPTDILLLKPVLAMSGDHVSTLHGELRINGELIGTIPDTDAAGRTLPRWRGDRVLADGELFVGSTRIEHSFDSRFFGPVHASQIVGVYRRLTLGVSSGDTLQFPR